ncbi:MAG: DinB family protein [Phycisphaerae bacterium]
MKKELIEAWRTNNRINLLLIQKITDEGMNATLSVRGGRGVAGELAHMHNIRVSNVEKRAKDLAEGLEKFPTGCVPTKSQLKQALKASADAVEQLLIGILDGQPKRRGFKKGLFTTLSYFIAHEAHHRGRILLTLKVSRNTLDKTTQMAIWGWDQM